MENQFLLHKNYYCVWLLLDSDLLLMKFIYYTLHLISNDIVLSHYKSDLSFVSKPLTSFYLSKNYIYTIYVEWIVRMKIYTHKKTDSKERNKLIKGGFKINIILSFFRSLLILNFYFILLLLLLLLYNITLYLYLYTQSCMHIYKTRKKIYILDTCVSTIIMMMIELKWRKAR